MEKQYTAQEVNEALDSLTNRSSSKVLKALKLMLGKEFEDFEDIREIVFDLMNNEKRFAKTKLLEK